MANRRLLILGGDEAVELDACLRQDLAGAGIYRSPDGRWLLPAFRSYAVDIGSTPLPSADDDDGLAALVAEWVGVVGGHDWAPLGGAQLEGDEDWIDLRTAMVRVGWGPLAAQAAWEACRTRPYSRNLPTAAGWAGAGWVVPAGADDVDPAFAHPVLEARSLLRWTYIGRWADVKSLPDGALAAEIEPSDLGGIQGSGSWADALSRLRQDHYPDTALAEAEQLAIEILVRAGLGPRSALEAEDEPLADRDLVPACTHTSPLVRAAAWFLLRDEADAWLACGYGECQHHWAVEAEEDAYEMDEVLELAGYGVANPVDAAHTRRRLLTMAFGDINDVPLAGAGDVADFVAFYTEWVAHGRPEEDFADAAREIRGD